MKRIATLLMVVGTVVFGSDHELWARGGGGGGGRIGGGGGGFSGGGGMARPAPSIARSPSLGGGASRPSPSINRPATGAIGTTRPSTGVRPGTGFDPGGRPTAGQLDSFLDIPRPAPGSWGVGGNTRPAGGGAAADFLRDGGADRPIAGNRPATGIENRANLAQNRPNRIENRQQWQQNRTERRNEVRDQVRENYPRLDFWSDHPNWAAWRINRPYRWATWALVTGWVGYGWGEPTSYSYGDNVYYQDDGVYYGDQQVATADEYAQQADAIAASAPDKSPDQSEWLPLGVFAVTQDGQATGAAPTLFMQLAISKEGIISGTLSNKSTGETQTLEGMADKKSQRAAWGVVGQQRPIIETGISNLTQDSAPALVHFADGQTQQWLLVRLEDPAGQN